MAIGSIALAGLLTGFVYVIWVGYQRRSTIYSMKKRGIVMPDDWSWIFGHLLSFGKLAGKLPSDANILYTTGNLSEQLKSETYLLDLWPMALPTLFTSDLEMARLVTVEHNCPKNKLLQDGMLPIAGGPDLVSMNGPQWKFWRGIFNHGFSMGATTAQIPAIVDSMEVFCELLRERAANGDMFCLEYLAMRLTMDVILKVTLDLDVDNQRKENPLSHGLRTILDWHSFWDPRILLNPLRPLVQWYYGRVLNRIIVGRMEELFAEMKSDDDEVASQLVRTKTKSVASLALKAYIEETENEQLLKRAKLDKHFAEYTSHQIRVFLFAGNDTTASTICWVLHTLSKHPIILAKVRAEHDEVFGRIPSRAATLLRENPALINKLEYTLAVIKETMRLHTVANTTRAGPPGLVLTDSAGRQFPTENIDIIVNGPRIHRKSQHWARVTEFLPERWLVQAGHELYPQHKDTYRPFETGPRACIGQNLVYHELKAVLVMTVRTFDFANAYEEWDAKQLDQEGFGSKTMRAMGFGTKLNTVDGERVYHTDSPGSSPSDGYPCHVKLRE